ncbi:MAG: hypothetical protein AB7O59_24035 [Pirellulales bacterium]
MKVPTPASICAQPVRRRLDWLFGPIAFMSLAFAPLVSAAAPIITGDLTVVENRPVDDFFGFPGLHLLTRVDASHPDGPGALSGPPANATVSSSNGDFPFANPSTLTQFSPAGLLGVASFTELFPITAADLNDIEGQYTYTVTDNDLTSTNHVGNDLDRAAVVPHPTNLAVSDYTTEPLFTFTDPDPDPAFGRLDRVYDMVIFDSSGNEVAILPSPTTSSTTPAFQIPAGLLTAGQQYWFRAQSIDIDTADFHVENIGESLLSFTPVPEPASHALAALGIVGVLPCARRLRHAVQRVFGHRAARSSGRSPATIA